jgi:hypothetical protein
MSNILFRHVVVTTKYVIMNGIIMKACKAYLYYQLHGKLQDLQYRGYLDQI